MLYTAIVLLFDTTAPDKITGAVKYRNVNNTDKFERFAMGKFPNIKAINFYTKTDKAFFKQIKFEI